MRGTLIFLQKFVKLSLVYLLLLMNLNFATSLEVNSPAPLKTIEMKGTTPNGNFGNSVKSAGDIDNDGYDDVIIGAMNKGVADAIYGGATTTLSSPDLSSALTLDPLKGFMITGSAVSDWLGVSVSSAGDINQDGYGDIIIGAYGRNNYQGAAYVIYGGPKSSMSNIDLSTPLDPLATGFMITGNPGFFNLGYSVSSAGDIDKDGYDDILIGAYGKSGSPGAAYLVYGGPKSSMSDIDLSVKTLDPLTTGFMTIGNAPYDFFGHRVSSAGDINQDGYDDIVIGASPVSPTPGPGNVYVLYGGEKSSLSNIDLANPLNRGFSISGTNNGDRVGTSVGFVDINHDGGSDLIIGSFGENSFTGAAYVLLYHFCPTNCKVCSAPATCKVCLMPYLLYSGQCVTTCPSKTFTLNWECQNCPAECTECTDSSTCQGYIDGYTLTRSQCVKDHDSEKVAAGVFEGTSLAGAALCSGSSLPLNFGLVAKILRNIKYMKLPASRELYEAFVSWKVASGFMSAPGSWSLKYSSKTIPGVFSRYELQAAFLINFWKPLVMTLIGIAVFVVFKVIEVSMNDKKSLVYTISRQVNVAASNFALTQFYSNLDDVIFYFILEMRSTKFETGFRVCSSLLAFMLFLVGAIFIGLHSKLIARYQNLKGKDSATQLEARYENINLIFKDFKDTDSLIQSFLMINVIRSVISSLIFATLFEYAMIQISLLFVLNILMIVYLCNKRSFKGFANTCGQIFCELVLFIANICVFLLALFDHADSYPAISIINLSKCVIVLNFILLFGCALLLLVSLGKTLYQSYLERKSAQPVPKGPLSRENTTFASVKFNRPGDSDQSLSTSIAERDSNYAQREKVSIKHPSQIESFDISSSSNIIEQSNQTQDFADTSQSNLLSNHLYPRSRLMRNRERTQARIAQTSGMTDNFGYGGSPESRIQELPVDQDASLTNFEIRAGSPPLRRLDGPNDFVPRRRGVHTMNEMRLRIMKK